MARGPPAAPDGLECAPTHVSAFLKRDENWALFSFLALSYRGGECCTWGPRQLFVPCGPGQPEGWAALLPRSKFTLSTVHVERRANELKPSSTAPSEFWGASFAFSWPREKGRRCHKTCYCQACCQVCLLHHSTLATIWS